MNKNPYRINKRVDEETRLLGLPLDESIPMLMIVLSAFLLKALLMGAVLAMICVVIIKHLKKGHGSQFLLNKLYWYCPKYIIKHHLIITPASEDRFFLG